MDDDQQFCLRWNNHQSTLISVFDTLLENGTLVDCTLAAEGKFLKAHKVVLSACSPYFAALLSQQYDKHPIFILKDVKFQELRAMMDYMYRGEVNISQDQLAALLKAAESLQIKGLSDNRSNSVPNKADNLVKPPPPVPAGPKGGLTISDAKRKQLLGGDLDTDLSTVTREGSTSPSRKRKKIGRRRSIDANNVLDNHEQHSNSSSHSHTTPHIAAAGAIAANAGNVTNNIATSTPIVLPVTKKTDHDQNKTADAAGIDSAAEHVDDHQEQANQRKDGKRTASDETHSELMIEPKNEYDDDEDDEGNEPVEDLTLDDEDMMDDMDQAGPSHGGEGSSSGYGNWPMERSQDEGFMVGQDGGQPRDAQDDLTITKIAGLTWSEWNARLAMPLVQTLREGPHPLVFSRDFGAGSVGSLDKLGMPGNNNGGNAQAQTDQTPQFACPDCGRMYKLKSSLRNHQKWECGKEPQFQCPYCVYRAKQKMHIGRHMERMHKERFFKVESDKVVALDMGGAGVEGDLANAMNLNMLNMPMNMNNTC